MKHMSHNSPASRGASIGAGPMGAGELNSPGSRPGAAAQRKVGKFKQTENPHYPTPSGAAPKGMRIYREE